jgi:8-oxo-dGTP pyrophosphatase MutT (NUDIX family)
MSSSSSPETGSIPEGSVPQAGTVPVRMGGRSVEVCLITSRGTGQWGFPKGNIDAGETGRSTALKETWEEAGVRGELVADLPGYVYAKYGRVHAVTMYVLRATAVADDWPERNQRRRLWVDTREAQRRIDRSELIPVLNAAVKALGG